MGDSREEHGDAAESPVIDWDELVQELDLPPDPFAACSDRTGQPPPDLGEALRAYNPVVPVRVPTSDEIWTHWIGVLRHRVEARWHNVVVITGEPGCGKSTLALRLARGVERGFAPDQVAYSATDMLGLYRRLGSGQVAVYDEAILGLLSNDFGTPEARELVKAVNIVRAKGITVLLCISDIYRLLAAWREEAVRFWIHCESEPRGTAWMHQRRTALRYERQGGLGLYKDPEWNPLKWTSLERTPFWKDYERRKLDRIDHFMEDSLHRLAVTDSAEKLRGRVRFAIRELLRDGVPWTRIRAVLQCGQADIAEVARELHRDTTTPTDSASTQFKDHQDEKGRNRRIHRWKSRQSRHSAALTAGGNH